MRSGGGRGDEPPAVRQFGHIDKPPEMHADDDRHMQGHNSNYTSLFLIKFDPLLIIL